jgi:hypothetical protein
MVCDYATDTAHLQSSHEQAVNCVSLLMPQYSNNNFALGLINGVLSDYQSHNPKVGQVHQINLEDFSFLLRFQGRTLRSMGSQWDTDFLETEIMRLVSHVR